MPPKQELALPYGSYCMIKGDGSAPDRADKHPFCMSRVFYDAAERPEELWAQLADGSCRWRQSGSEIKVVALRVRAGLLIEMRIVRRGVRWQVISISM